MSSLFQICVKRCVPIDDLSIAEVTVLPEYFAIANTIDDALGEFYWHAPIEDHSHFAIETSLMGVA